MKSSRPKSSDRTSQGAPPPRAHASLRIALVGGLDRCEACLTKIAEDAGHRLECHRGLVGGRGADELKAMVRRCDLVVIQTKVNSHGSMYLAKDLARRFGREAVVLPRCGPRQLEALLESRGVGAEATALRRSA